MRGREEDREVTRLGLVRKSRVKITLKESLGGSGH